MNISISMYHPYIRSSYDARIRCDEHTHTHYRNALSTENLKLKVNLINQNSNRVKVPMSSGELPNLNTVRLKLKGTINVDLVRFFSSHLILAQFRSIVLVIY